MSRRSGRRGAWRATGRILAAAVLAWGLATAPSAALADGPDDVIVTIPETDANGGPTTPPGSDGRITNAQLRWGLNAESGGGAFAGGCNFLSAGRAGDSGSARVWSASDGLYRAADGAVRIEKPTADGGWTAASWETKCLDPAGATVTTASTSMTTGNQVVIDGGTGSRTGGGLEIRWSGSFTVVFYGGMTYWSVTDPVLSLDASGAGRLTGTASGYGTSMDDMTKWEPIAETTVVLADITGAAGERGFSAAPAYLGVATVGAGQVERTPRNAAVWGSFPQSFVDFHRLTGQQGYWLTTNGVRDAAKPASPLTVSYDAASPVAVPPPAAGGAGATGGATPSNPIRLPSSAAEVASDVPSFIAANAPLTVMPQPLGLVPDAAAAISPLVLPLLASGSALGLAAIAVLSMMQRLPWQRAP
ncbi:hypothetical protein [Microbacterium sp. cf332]|uniref:hypothetical protein n=1 Tax=Microbacterium sp. cf332 TaxID=1761804 RepID=UPI0008862061|nr:hypothetical protein [Microbacterium sp. cf332]SDQ61580.1 hypothetical protein SAMN04487847_2088 [Microbacterium sp. cf332]